MVELIDRPDESAPGRVGRALLTIGWIALGLIGLGNQDFVLQWQPIPLDLPFRSSFADVSALLLVAGGAGLIHPRSRRLAAAFLGLDVLLWIVCLKLPEAFAHPGSVGSWLGIAEDTTLMLGPMVLASRTPPAGAFFGMTFLDDPRIVRGAQIVFALCCLEFAVCHFVYADFTAAMIPDWIPGHLALAYLTGACHLAAGLAILAGFEARLAAGLEALMMSLFALLLHLPSIWERPLPGWGSTVETVWVMLFIATSLSASAWMIATSIKRAEVVADAAELIADSGV